MLERLATRGERAEQLPKGLKQALARIENSGADERAIADARSLLYDRYHQYRQPPMTNTYRETLLERRAGFTRDGFPPHIADRLAQRETEAFTQTAKAQRMIDSVAANNTNQWFEKIRTAGQRSDIELVDRLAQIHHNEQATLGDRLHRMHDDVDSAQQRLSTLLERSPELMNKGADRWVAGLRTQRSAVTRLSEALDSRAVETADLQGPEANIRGYDGEIRMAERLDNIEDLGPLVDVTTPTGARMASEVDIVTDEGRVWHEVKTHEPDTQRSSAKELEAQGRKQLAISYMNREYWVDGKPPELKEHFMNGVDPAVKSRIEAIRIEDENGHIVHDHRIEVIDES
ncbi:hypothetical protein [Nocardia vaccinii]|uniref:hypothetical protein n=1 Tax=Nocardia vaccinii TaxID=1822 RepID=UPI0012F4A85E|nr:hypothetical protein [Nocardia vaccinii]